MINYYQDNMNDNDNDILLRFSLGLSGGNSPFLIYSNISNDSVTSSINKPALFAAACA